MNYNTDKYKVYTWKSWMMIHWILNPGLAINELILGQRMPKISLEDITSDKPRYERTFVPCPHCDTLHDSRIWSTQHGTAFKNWFGLYCYKCGGIIPCLTNGLSFLILMITFPVWAWFRNRLKEKWLEKQPKRYQNIDFGGTENHFDKTSWVKTGLIWGLFMFVIMTIVYPSFYGPEITVKSVLIGFTVWIIAGLGFGYIMKVYLNKSIGKKTTGK